MIESPVVRNVLLLPLLFLFIFLPFLLLVAGVDLLAFWGPRLNGASPDLSGEVLLRLPRSLVQALPVSVCGALALLVFRIRRTGGSLFLSFLLILLSALVVLDLGYEAYGLLPGEAARGSVAAAGERSPGRYLVEGRFGRLDGTTVYAAAVGEDGARGVVAVREDGPGPRLGWSPRVVAEWRDGLLRLRPANPAGSGATPAVPRFAAAQPAGADLFRVGAVAAGWAADARVLNAELETRHRRGRTSFFLLTFALLFFLTSAFFLLRTARWPLLGAAFGFLLLRGTFFLFAFFQGRLIVELHKLAPGARWVALLPVAALLLAGALLLLVALLRAPLPALSAASPAMAGKGPGHG